MKEFQGTYRGFTPTDESAVGLGEIEIAVDESTFKIRTATGLKIVETEVPISLLVPMRELTVSLFGDQEVVDLSRRAAGFTTNGGEPYYAFLREFLDDESLEEPGLVVRRGGMHDLMGPTFLYNPKQVEAGMFEEAIRKIEENLGQSGDIPKLDNGGKAPNRS